MKAAQWPAGLEIRETLHFRHLQHVIHSSMLASMGVPRVHSLQSYVATSHFSVARGLGSCRLVREGWVRLTQDMRLFLQSDVFSSKCCNITSTLQNALLLMNMIILTNMAMMMPKGSQGKTGI